MQAYCMCLNRVYFYDWSVNVVCMCMNRGYLSMLSLLLSL